MKNGLLVLSLLFSTVGHAGPSISGGIPPAPRAVVVQGHLTQNGFDLIGRNKAFQLAALHFTKDVVLAVAQRQELQYADRSYLCIEYRNHDLANEASQEFKQVLADHPTMEVVWNSSCK